MNRLQHSHRAILSFQDPYTDAKLYMAARFTVRQQVKSK